MSIALLLFCLIVLFAKLFAVQLSVLIFVGGCGNPISINVCLSGIACLAFMNSPAISASAADDIMNFIIFARTNIDPFMYYVIRLLSFKEVLVYTLANRVVSCASIRFALRKVSVTVTAELAGWPGLLCARFLGVARSVNILIHPFRSIG